MPALTAGPEILVNTTTSGNQIEPKIIALAGGGFAVVWEDTSATGADTSSSAVRGQILDANGAAVGPEFLVNQNTTGRQYPGDIAATASGGFIVTWTDDTGDGSGSAVKARIYDALGNPLGTEILLNTITGDDQWQPWIEVLPSGNFVVSWTHRSGDSSLYAVKAQMFDSSGGLVGSEFQVNTTESLYQVSYEITALNSGGFVITFDDFSHLNGDSSRYSVRGQIYDDAGNRVGGEFLINTTTANDQGGPYVEALSGGGFVVAWMDNSFAGTDTSGWSIRARLFDDLGVPTSGEFEVNTSTAGDQYPPRIVAFDSGGFMIAWQDQFGDGSGFAIKAQMFDSNGTRDGGEIQLNDETLNDQVGPWLTATDSGFAAVWSDASGALGDTSGYGVVLRQFSFEAPPTLNAGPETLVNTTTTGNQSAPEIAALDGGGLIVVWEDNSASGPDTSASSVRAQLYDGNGNPVGGEFLVNTITSGNQSHPDVTALDGGGFVVIWWDSSGLGGDTSPPGIKAQIFNSAGTPVGGEFLVNTSTFSSQYQPTVAALPGGGFVAAWQDYSGGASVISVQRFDGGGNKVGGQFVASGSGSDQHPAVAVFADGSFVVSWTDNSPADGSDYAVKAQMFDSAGNLVAGEFLVNTTTFGRQEMPSIAVLANGSFVIAWQDQSGSGGDSSVRSIQARLFDSSGAPLTGEFLVNTSTTNAQEDPAVVAMAGGGFIVTWTDMSGEGGDSSDSSIKGQIFDALGNKVGSEFLVNATTQGIQQGSSIAMTGAESFAVAWYDYSGIDDTSGSGIKLRTFSFSSGPNVINGTEGDDTINGTPGDDLINALGGNDFVWADSGNDTLYGGDGNDTLIGAAGDDQIEGGGGNDFVVGEDGNDTVLGGDGSDTLRGGLGDDVLDGGAGFDRVSNYGTSSTTGVTVSLLLQGTPQDTGQGMDTLTDIEALSGTPYNDTLIGDHSANWLIAGGDSDDTLIGNGGDDLLEVGGGIGGGDHSLDGGSGIDTVSFLNLNNAPGMAAVNVSLALQGTAQDTGNGMMTLTDIENLSGSIFDDSLTGDGGANLIAGHVGDDVLAGGAGDDLLYGDGAVVAYFPATGGAGPITFFSDVTTADPALVGGNDVIEGGLGNDFLDGGGGIDTARYANASGGVNVNLGAGFANGADGNDTLANIENVIGSEFDDTFLGNDGDNILDGLGGSDTINGFGGNDTLEGGDGDDLLFGDGGINYNGPSGDDVLIGGGGNDFLRGGAGVDSYDGGDGFDRVSFIMRAATQGVVASLITQTVSNDGFGNAETMVSIEGLGAGTAFADQLTGDDNNNLLLGARGDTLVGNGGNDDFEIASAPALINGGTGTDVLKLVNGTWLLPDGDDSDALAELAPEATSGWFVNLGSGALVDGYGNSGTVTGVENVDGSALADGIVGDGNANVLKGLDGDDFLFGGGGGDTLHGGGGNDVIAGGTGADRFVIEAASGDDRVTDFTDGLDKIVFDPASGVDSFSDLTITKMGKNVLITWGTDDSLLLENVKAKDLSDADFIFG